MSDDAQPLGGTASEGVLDLDSAMNAIAGLDEPQGTPPKQPLRRKTKRRAMSLTRRQMTAMSRAPLPRTKTKATRKRRSKTLRPSKRRIRGTKRRKPSSTAFRVQHKRL